MRLCMRRRIPCTAARRPLNGRSTASSLPTRSAATGIFTFQSRDLKGMGTVNLAARPWKQPLRKNGFVLSGHQGPSLTLLQRAFADFRLEAKLRLRGTVRLVFDYRGALGPNAAQSDATLHPLTLSRCDAVELEDHAWKVVRFGELGQRTVLASGYCPGGETVTVGLDRKPGDETRLFVDDQALWAGELPPHASSVVVPTRQARVPGFTVLGIAVEPHSHLVVEQFSIQGRPQPATINHLFTETILGAGGSPNDWQDLRGPEYRYGLAALSKAPVARVKWNVEGRQFTLWSPRGPKFGTGQIKVDGRVLANIDLHAERLTASQPVWNSRRLKDGLHAVALTATDGLLVVDSLEVTR